MTDEVDADVIDDQSWSALMVMVEEAQDRMIMKWL